ncbi:MAG: LacI family transcriptional regulator, partial [Promicromonosporaceae bacterium]|nr:LacI family transcriptional regulator [Promicromonosporaceae bacterium]
TMSSPESGNGRPTIYAITELTGFSPSTVSRALHKPGRINPKTAKTIADAAEQLGYRVNPLARSLPTGRSGLVGLVVSDIANPVFVRLIRGAEQSVAAQDRMLVLAETQMNPELELERVERLLPAVDGFILVASRLTDEQIREFAARKPLVSVNRRVEGVASVLPTGERGMNDAIKALADLGHRSIAFISGPPGSWVSAVRWEQLMLAAQENGMSAVEIGTTSATAEISDDIVKRVIASGVTAVHTYNDLVAAGLMQAFAKRGVAIPEQLSVLGHDDSLESGLTTPAISTIRTPMQEIGIDAVGRLVGLLDGVESPEEPERSTEFVARDSLGPAPTN